jgi:hypothetical protein
VGFFIACVAAAFLFFVGVIYYYSWLHRPLNTTVLVVQGDASWVGATVHVELDGLGIDPHEAILDAASDYEVHMALGKGKYAVRILRNGQVWWTLPPITIDEHQIATIRLPKPAATAPASGR